VSGYAAVFAVVAVMVALWHITALIRRRREGERPRFGDADAFEGNLLVPPAGEPHGRSGHGHGPGGHGHGGFGGHEGFGGHSSHGGGHDGGGGGGHH
jgi:hypothetical protein